MMKTTKSTATLPPAARAKIVAATLTVRTRQRGTGQGVLIGNQWILTAAHCVDFDVEGSMALGDSFLVRVSRGASSFEAEVLLVEPRADIALLGCPDGQTQARLADRFAAACDGVQPTALSRAVPQFGEPFDVWIRTHIKTWVKGTAEYFRGGGFSIETTRPIRGGTSGGPIVNAKGEIVGVVSSGQDGRSGDQLDASGALACLALPRWVMRQLDDFPIAEAVLGSGASNEAVF